MSSALKDFSAATKATTSSKTKAQSLAKQKLNERPLVEDIRLLGRILGDVIREQEGAPAFDLIEEIRKGGADNNLDYLEVVHVFIRRENSSCQALHQARKAA